MVYHEWRMSCQELHFYKFLLDSLRTRHFTQKKHNNSEIKSGKFTCIVLNKYEYSRKRNLISVWILWNHFLIWILNTSHICTALHFANTLLRHQSLPQLQVFWTLHQNHAAEHALPVDCRNIFSFSCAGLRPFVRCVLCDYVEINALVNHMKYLSSFIK